MNRLMFDYTLIDYKVISSIFFTVVSLGSKMKLFNGFFSHTSCYCVVWRQFQIWSHYWSLPLKGKFPQTTMWIGWVESNFTNPSVKVWADLDNPFKRSDYAKLCMLPSLDGTLPEYVISQEDNSPLTLYIDFHNFSFFFDINRPFDQVQS